MDRNLYLLSFTNREPHLYDTQSFVRFPRWKGVSFPSPTFKAFHFSENGVPV